MPGQETISYLEGVDVSLEIRQIIISFNIPAQIGNLVVLPGIDPESAKKVSNFGWLINGCPDSSSFFQGVIAPCGRKQRTACNLSPGTVGFSFSTVAAERCRRQVEALEQIGISGQGSRHGFPRDGDLQPFGFMGNGEPAPRHFPRPPQSLENCLREAQGVFR